MQIVQLSRLHSEKNKAEFANIIQNISWKEESLILMIQLCYDKIGNIIKESLQISFPLVKRS